ncbi:hypothetical protein MMPV_005116 [Pyropia vietnamensis]
MGYVHLGARDRRAAAIVGAALRGGTLSPTDVDGAAAALAAALPDVRRLPAGSRVLLARRALAAAAADAADAAKEAAATASAGVAVAAALRNGGGEGGSSGGEGSDGEDGDAAGGGERSSRGIAPAGSANALNELVAPRGAGGAAWGAPAAPSPPPTTARDAGGSRATPGGRRKKKRPRGEVPPDGDGGRGDPGDGGGATATSGTPTYRVPRPTARLSDVGGVDAHLAALTELVALPLTHPELYGHLGVPPPRGVLLHGPPGCGKTLLATALAGELGLPFFRLAATEVVSGVSGDSERRLRSLFAEAAAAAPAVVFIDEVDAIGGSRSGAAKEMERRIVSQLISCMDANAAGGVVEGGEGGEGADGGSGDLGGTNADGVAVGGGGAGSAGGGVVGGGGDTVSIVTATGGTTPSAAENSPPDPVPPPPPPRNRTVIVLGATNRPEVLDPALRRAGRFDRELEVGAPDAPARAAILTRLCRGLRLDGDLDVGALADRTGGYVGADLASLVSTAGTVAIRRITGERGQVAPTSASAAPAADAVADTIMADEAAAAAAVMEDGATGSIPLPPCAPSTGPSPSPSAPPLLLAGDRFTPAELSRLAVTTADFNAALRLVQPSALREGFATAPAVTWADVGALASVRADLTAAVVAPLRYPAAYAALGLSVPAGVLLYGPPGCGKTLLAKAVAAESRANFISVKGPELLNKWVGESERAVRRLFARARASAPCVVFFDELDALAPRRGGGDPGGAGGGGGGGSSGAAERVVNQLLTELDGVDDRRAVYVVAATNRPDMIDPAMLRPGRLDKLLYVPLPDAVGRAAVLATLTRRTPLGGDVDVAAIAADPRTERFSGADLGALVREAALGVLRETAAVNPTGAPASTPTSATSVDVLTPAVDIPAPAAGARTAAAAAAAATAAASTLRVHARHFDDALSRVGPSVSAKDARLYQRLARQLRGGRRPGVPTPVLTEVGGGDDDAGGGGAGTPA